jgi:hypothetical protein
VEPDYDWTRKTVDLVAMLGELDQDFFKTIVTEEDERRAEKDFSEILGSFKEIPRDLEAIMETSERSKCDLCNF